MDTCFVCNTEYNIKQNARHRGICSKCYMKEYRQKHKNTDKEIKRCRIKSWKRIGVIEYGYTFEILYDYYINTNICEVCKNPIKHKRLDHNHNNGCFRFVLCCRCNNLDKWEKLIHTYPLVNRYILY